MENKQTVVEWIKEEMYKLEYDRHFLTFEEFYIRREKLWKQAQQMHKEQIMDAYIDSHGNITEPEDYYNQTYNIIK